MPHRRFLAIAVAALSALLALPVLAQQELRLPTGEAYTHPHSGVIVPAEVGGLARSRALAYTEDHLDVSMAFDSAGSREALTVYIFRRTNGDVPVWFAQAQAALENRPEFHSPELAFEAAAFVPPGQVTASGLRAFYTVDEGQFRSTGVALFATGEWYVKLRASSASRSAAQLALWMDEVLRALEVPAGTTNEAMPIADCAGRLEFRGRSRDVAGDGADGGALAGVLGNLIMQAARDSRAQEAEANEEPEVPVVWCRDQVVAPSQIVYRANGSTDSYLLALGDNGNALEVAPDTMAQLLAEERDGPSGTYAVTLMMAAQNLSLVTQDRMPSPERVMQLVDQNRVTGSVNTWGSNRSIEISADSFKD